MREYFGGIEAGGTKFVVAIGTKECEILEQKSIPTTTPAETMPAVIKFFKESQFKIKGLGIGSFGPVDLKRDSPFYGSITSTPKLAWQNFDILGAMKKHFNIPMGFDLDVGAAALGEHYFGAARGIKNFIYITVGTGIGAGAMIDGKILHGHIHPEMGHIRIQHDKGLDPFEGVCPFHKDCLEGLASGPSICKRFDVEFAHQLPQDHKAWDLEANYLAQATMNYTLVLSPQKIIMGGGVMKYPGLIQKIRTEFVRLLNEYVKSPLLKQNIEQYLVLPGLKERSGISGSIALGIEALEG
jgi:fructokinase